jgi:hypothetical protein
VLKLLLREATWRGAQRGEIIKIQTSLVDDMEGSVALPPPIVDGVVRCNGLMVGRLSDGDRVWTMDKVP